MKKMIFLVTILSLFIGLGVVVNPVVKAEDNGLKVVLMSDEEQAPAETEEPATEEAEETEEEKEVFECSVKLVNGKGGDALIDIEQGHVGDTATAIVKADILFNVVSVKINGVSVPVSKDGVYKFQLVNGENTIETEYAVNNEKLKEIAELLSNVKDNGIKSLFTMSNLLNLISWLVTFFLSSGFLITLIKTKTLKAKTTNEVEKVVVETINSQLGEIVKEFLEKTLSETIGKILEKIDVTDESVKALCRCFILAQEGTPEARLAIIEELTKLNNSNVTLSEQIRAIIKQEQEKQLKAIEERDKAIEELKEKNQKLVSDEEQEEVQEDLAGGDNYGQL